MVPRSVIIVFLLLCLLASSCSIIAGTDEGVSPVSTRQLRFHYVETLRDQASLRGESLREIKLPANAADAEQRLLWPTAVFADPFRVYVADRHPASPWPGRIAIFDRGLKTMTTVTMQPIPPASVNDKFRDPTSITMDGPGLLYLAEPLQGRVFGIDRAGIMHIVFGVAGDLSKPTGIAADPVRNRIYIADKGFHRVMVYSTTGALLFELGGGAKASQLRSPVAIVVDRNGICSVLGAGRVSQYDPEGRFLRAFPVKTETPSSSRRLTGIAVDSAGHIYVSDAGSNAIHIFDRDGAFLQSWGSGAGARRDELWTPAGIFIDNQDLIYIADQMNGRIQVYQYQK